MPAFRGESPLLSGKWTQPSNDGGARRRDILPGREVGVLKGRISHLESTTIWRLESRQNPHAGKRALRSAAFPGCGLAELSSSATGARLRRILVVVSMHPDHHGGLRDGACKYSG